MSLVMRKPLFGSLRPGTTQTKIMRYDFLTTVLSNVYRIKQLLTFISVNMKCYWTVNSSYWPPLRVSQYEVNTSWPPQQKSIVLQYWKQKINSFSYAEKKIMAYVHQLLDQPSQWQTSQQAGPCSVPKFTNTSITVKHLLIKNKNINQSKSSLLIWHYVSYLFLSTITLH